MNSIAGGSDAGGSNEDGGFEDTTFLTAEEDQSSVAEGDAGDHDRLNYSMQEEDADLPAAAQITGHGENVDDGDADVLDIGLRTPPIASPAESSSIPDDSPSIQGTQLSLPIRGISGPRGSISRTPSGALQPFERRFQSFFSASPSPSPRAGSPAFLTSHSRQSSIVSQIPSQLSSHENDIHEAAQMPWEVVRWTRLKKITGQAFSEVGKRQFGSPTCLAVSASIVIGTSKGLILIFDYHQTLKAIIGQGTKGNTIP